jgi:hypothetical protein
MKNKSVKCRLFFINSVHPEGCIASKFALTYNLTYAVFPEELNEKKSHRRLAQNFPFRSVNFQRLRAP